MARKPADRALLRSPAAAEEGFGEAEGPAQPQAEAPDASGAPGAPDVLPPEAPAPVRLLRAAAGIFRRETTARISRRESGPTVSDSETAADIGPAASRPAPTAAPPAERAQPPAAAILRQEGAARGESATPAATPAAPTPVTRISRTEAATPSAPDARGSAPRSRARVLLRQAADDEEGAEPNAETGGEAPLVEEEGAATGIQRASIDAGFPPADPGGPPAPAPAPASAPRASVARRPVVTAEPVSTPPASPTAAPLRRTPVRLARKETREPGADPGALAAFEDAVMGAGPRGDAADTSGLRLAAATGAAIFREPSGMETVTFDGASGISSGAGGLYRALTADSDDGGPPPDMASAAPAETASSPPPPPAAAGGGGASNIDEIYEQVVERLRRDLLVERERMGDLLGDLP